MFAAKMDSMLSRGEARACRSAPGAARWLLRWWRRRLGWCDERWASRGVLMVARTTSGTAVTRDDIPPANPEAKKFNGRASARCRARVSGRGATGGGCVRCDGVACEVPGSVRWRGPGLGGRGVRRRCRGRGRGVRRRRSRAPGSTPANASSRRPQPGRDDGVARPSQPDRRGRRDPRSAGRGRRIFRPSRRRPRRPCPASRRPRTRRWP
jgi:hypothetical protein